MKSALRAVGESANDEKIEALICNQVNKEKRLLQDEFDKKVGVSVSLKTIKINTRSSSDGSVYPPNRVQQRRSFVFLFFVNRSTD